MQLFPNGSLEDNFAGGALLQLSGCGLLDVQNFTECSLRKLPRAAQLGEIHIVAKYVGEPIDTGLPFFGHARFQLGKLASACHVNPCALPGVCRLSNRKRGTVTCR